MARGSTLRIKYVRSSIGRSEQQKRIVRNHFTLIVVNQLRVDMPEASKDTQSRLLSRATDLASHSLVNPQSPRSSGELLCHQTPFLPTFNLTTSPA